MKLTLLLLAVVVLLALPYSVDVNVVQTDAPTLVLVPVTAQAGCAFSRYLGPGADMYCAWMVMMDYWDWLDWGDDDDFLGDSSSSILGDGEDVSGITGDGDDLNGRQGNAGRR